MKPLQLLHKRCTVQCPPPAVRCRQNACPTRAIAARKTAAAAVKSAEPHVATIEEPTANGVPAKPAQPASPRHDLMEGDAVIERELAENGDPPPASTPSASVRLAPQKEETALMHRDVLPPVQFLAALQCCLTRPRCATGFRSTRRTKLICTIGPASCSPGVLESLASSGMNVARLNMCHGTHEWHIGVIERIRQLNKSKGCAGGRRRSACAIRQ